VKILKSSDIIVDDHYLFLVYDDNKEIIVLRDIDELPEEYDKKYVRPMKYVELFYLSVFDIVDKYPGITTRYPITGFGSVYPCKIYLKVTTKGREVKYKGLFNIEPITIYEYPDFKSAYFNSMAVHPTHLDKLGGDYDGLELVS